MKIPVIVCGGELGRAVIFGYAKRLPKAKESCTIYDARMVLRWDEKCGGLFGLAAKGPVGETKVTSTVEQVNDIWQQALTVSDFAANSFLEWPDA